MKQVFAKKVGSLLVLLLCLAAGSTVKAQACGGGYVIQNNSACSVKIDYRMVCTNTSFTCTSVTGATILSGGSITLGGCDVCTTCNFIVRLRVVGTTAITPVIVDMNTTSGSYPATPGCAAGTLTWTSTSTTIN